MFPDNEGVRKEILAALEYVYEGGAADPLAPKLAALIVDAFTGAEDREWDEVSARFRNAFSLDEEAAASLLAGRVLAQRPPIEVTDTGSGFEKLIPDGWFRRYLEWTQEHESPDQYHFGAPLTAIAGGLGRRPRIVWEARPLYPNLYTLLVGPTGARKGAAIDKALKVAVPALGTHILATEGTHQGLAEALRRRFATTTMMSDGLIVAPEFSVLVSTESHKSAVAQWLTDWYDCPDHWERALRTEEQYVLQNLAVSMLGGSNVAWLKTMPENAITGGFLPRILIFIAKDKKHWKARPRFNNTLELELRHGLERVLDNLPEQIGFTRESEAMLDRWYEERLRAQYERTQDERVQAWIARKQAALMKVAAIWQLVDGGNRLAVEPKYMAQAAAVVDWCDRGVEHVYGALGVTTDGAAGDEVLGLIRRAGGRLRQQAIIRALLSKHRMGKIKEALDGLAMAGVIGSERNPAEGVVWVLKR